MLTNFWVFGLIPAALDSHLYNHLCNLCKYLKYEHILLSFTMNICFTISVLLSNVQTVVKILKNIIKAVTYRVAFNSHFELESDMSSIHLKAL